MRWRYRERMDGFSGRETLKLGNHDFDHEAPTRLQMRGDIAEARNLLVLGSQVHDRVADEVGKGERSVNHSVREFADRHTNLIRAPLPAPLRDPAPRTFT